MSADYLSERLTVRFNEADRAAIEAFAKKKRLEPSDIVRMGTMAYVESEGNLSETQARFVQLMREVEAEYGASKKKPMR